MSHPTNWNYAGMLRLSSLLRLYRHLQEARFKGMSDTIIGRIDEMGKRVEDLERSITELMDSTGAAEGQNAGSSAASTNAASTAASSATTGNATTTKR